MSLFQRKPSQLLSSLPAPPFLIDQHVSKPCKCSRILQILCSIRLFIINECGWRCGRDHSPPGCSLATSATSATSRRIPEAPPPGCCTECEYIRGTHTQKEIAYVIIRYIKYIFNNVWREPFAECFFRLQLVGC